MAVATLIRFGLLTFPCPTGLAQHTNHFLVTQLLGPPESRVSLLIRDAEVDQFALPTTFRVEENPYDIRLSSLHGKNQGCLPLRILYIQPHTT